MRPAGLKTRIFLDSGDPGETREALKVLGFLDGQTTNPSLIAKNPETQGKKFSKEEIFQFYKKIVEEVSGLIPRGSVSIEVYADKDTTSEEMLKQAREFYTWIPPHPALSREGRGKQSVVHIKFPTTAEGLKAAEQAVKEGIRVNMTLVFSQAQAAAVYAATRGASSGDVFLSPFIGRLDDRGENGMDLIANIIKMYEQGDAHVEVLTASVRNLNHMAEALKLGSDIITAPLKVLKEWSDLSLNPSPSPGEGNRRGFLSSGGGERAGERSNLKPIIYQEIDLHKEWRQYDIGHELTALGIEKFAADWNALVG